MPDPGEVKGIRPRTEGEQHAYMDGYADAIIEIGKNGMRSAQEWLKTMALATGRIKEEDLNGR